MALYRNTTTGFLGEFASAPGGAWSAVSAMPANESSRVTWWRSLDVDAALFGQSSAWHPSLPNTGSVPEIPSAQGLSGSGVNVMPARYATFSEPDGPPPMQVSSATAVRSGTGYFGGNPILATFSAANATVVLAPTSATYNIPISPGGKWIFSAYINSATANVELEVIMRPSSGSGPQIVQRVSVVPGWQRVSCLFDFSGNTDKTALIYFRSTAAYAITFDAVMLEAQIGTGTDPSAFSAPPAVVDGAQIVSLKVSKLESDTSSSLDFVLNGTGAKLRSSNYVAGSSGILIRGDGFAEFQNVMVRGSLNATDLVAGFINGARFGTDTIGGGPVVGGAIHAQRGATIFAATVPSINSVTIGSSAYWSSGLSLPANANRSGVLLIATLQPTSAGAHTEPSYWYAGFGRNSTSSVLSGSQIAVAAPATATSVLAASGTMTYWDAGAGTGAVTYYVGAQQYISSSNKTFTISWVLIEFSKA